MIAFKVRVNSLIAEYIVSKSALQHEIRESLQAPDGPCKLWIDRFLPRHFEPFAVPKYGYVQRSRKWNRIKTRGSRHLGIPPQNPPRPLVWTGEAKRPGSLIEAVLGAARSGDLLARARGIARGERIEARIKVPIPHPIHTINAGELTRWSEDEKNAMDNAAIAALQRRLQNHPRKIRETETIVA